METFFANCMSDTDNRVPVEVRSQYPMRMRCEMMCYQLSMLLFALSE